MRTASSTIPLVFEAVRLMQREDFLEMNPTAESHVAFFDAVRTLFDDREPLVSLIVPDLIRWQDRDSREDLVDVDKRRGGDFPDLRLQLQADLKLHPGAD